MNDSMKLADGSCTTTPCAAASDAGSSTASPNAVTDVLNKISIQRTLVCQLKTENAGSENLAAPPKPLVVAHLLEKITARSNRIRKLKAENAGKDKVIPEIHILMALKADYKRLTDSDWTPEAGAAAIKLRRKVPKSKSFTRK